MDANFIEAMLVDEDPKMRMATLRVLECIGRIQLAWVDGIRECVKTHIVTSLVVFHPCENESGIIVFYSVQIDTLVEASTRGVPWISLCTLPLGVLAPLGLPRLLSGRTLTIWAKVAHGGKSNQRGGAGRTS